MENNNQHGHSDRSNRENQQGYQSGGRQGMNDPNDRDQARFSQDNDDFLRGEDNRDNERRTSQGGFADFSDQSSDYRASDRSGGMGDSSSGSQSRHSSGMNDDDMTRRTNRDSQSGDAWSSDL
jgi:hypothetical protein